MVGDQKTENSLKAKNRNILSEGILIGVATIAGYLNAYFYKVAYLNYFGIPEIFVRLSISDILRSITITLFSVIFIVFILDIFFMFEIINFKSSIRRSISQIIILFLMFGIIILLSPDMSVKKKVTFILFWVVLAIIQLVSPLVFQRNKSSFEDKFREHEKSEKKALKKGLIYKILKIYRKDQIVVVYVLFTLTFLSSLCGSYNAMKTSKFLVIPEISAAILDRDELGFIAVKYIDENKAAVYGLKYITPEEIRINDWTMVIKEMSVTKASSTFSEKRLFGI